MKTISWSRQNEKEANKQGWTLFADDREVFAIGRLPEEAFASDMDAGKFVIDEAKKGNPNAMQAIYFLGFAAPEELEKYGFYKRVEQAL